MKSNFTLSFLLIAVLALSTFTAGAQCTTLLLKPGGAQGLDAHITNNHPTQNYGRDSVFTSIHWTILGVPIESRGLLKFDLSQIPVGATITSAKLNLYADSTSERGYSHQPTYGSNNASYLKMVTAPWDRDVVTWNTQPATTTAGQVLLAQSNNYVQNYLNLDLTAFTQQWVNNPNANYGVLLQMITTSYYNSMVFCSSDFPDSTLWPSLEVCYIPQPPCNTVAALQYQHLGNGQVAFTNNSTSDAGYYSSWVFYNNDGIFAVSNEQNPTVTYTGVQPFFVSLTVTDSAFSQCYSTTYSMIDLVDCITFQPHGADGKQAYISTLSPLLNNSTTPDFMALAWANGNVPYEGRSLMQFDVTAIPAGSTIVSALLDLYADSTSANGNPGVPNFGNTNSANLMQVTAPWDKNTVTWNTQPSATPVNQVLLGQTRGIIDYERIDVATFVQDWVNTPGQNYGMLMDMIASNYYNSLIFCSANHPDSTLHPRLNVCYISGRLNSQANDTLCGFVFKDLNSNGSYDSGDSAQPYAAIMIDGNIRYADADGYYRQIVTAGSHSVGVVPAYNQTQTFPTPPVYTVSTSGGQGICGFDFGLATLNTGLGNLSSNNNLFIYPNPTSGQVFNLMLPDGFAASGATVTLTGIMGQQLVVNNTLQQNLLTVSVAEELPAGIYLVTVKNSTQQLTGKVSVVK
jgi:hypothetical protein